MKLNYEDVKSRLIAGLPPTPYTGDITFSDIILAEKFIDAFPIQTEFSVEQFDKWIETAEINGDKTLPFPPQGRGTFWSRVFTLIRHDYKKRINNAACHKQWRQSDSFQIVIENQGTKWKTVSAAEGAIDAAGRCQERPQKIEKLWEERAMALADKADPQKLFPEQRKQLIEATYIVAPPKAQLQMFKRAEELPEIMLEESNEQ